MTGARAVLGDAGGEGRGRPTAHRARHLRRRHRAARACCTRASCAARSPRAAIRGIDTVGRARAARACAACSPPPTSTPTSRSSGTRRSGRGARRRRARRSPTTRCASSATRSRWWSPRAVPRRGRGRARRRRLRAADPRSSTTRPPSDADALVHEAHGSNVIGELAGLPASALDDVFASAAHVVDARRSTSRRTRRVPMEGRGLVVDYSPATGELTIYAATQSPHEVRLFCSRLLGIPEHRIRVIMRDTGGGFGQKILVQRDEMCLMLAAPKVGAPLKWVEDRRENLLAAGKSRHEHADVTHGVRRRRHDPGRAHRLRAGLRRVPDAVAGDDRGRGRHAVPRPVPRAAAPASRPRRVYTNTVGRTAYRGPWQFETLAREVLLDIAARRDGHRPGRAAAPQPAAAATTCRTRNPNGMTYDSISPLETFEQALEILDYDAFRAEQAAARAEGRYLGVGISQLRRAVDARATATTRPRRATIRIEPSGAVNVYIAGGSTGNSIETTVVQLAADALGVDIDDVEHDPGRHRGHRLRRRAPPAAAAASMTAGAVARDRGDPARAHRRDRRAQARGRGRRHRARRAAARSVRGTPDDRRVVRRDRRARVLRAARAAARRAGRARGERALHRGSAGRSG